jgi:hypothetical protein
MKHAARALLIGTAVALVFFGTSYASSALGLRSLSRLLYWQGWWLQSFLPCLSVGTASAPVCEGTPLSLVAFFAGIPFGVVLYSIVAFVLLAAQRKKA